MIVISFALVKFYAFAILYVLIVMQMKLVVVVDFIDSYQFYRWMSLVTESSVNRNNIVHKK